MDKKGKSKTLDSTPKKPKEKRRSNEKRKEKSRDAARCRRSRETEIFTELAQILPLEKEDVSQLDKASIMRVAIAYLKIRDMLQMFPKIPELSMSMNVVQKQNNTNPEITQSFLKKFDTAELMTQTLDGFLLILSNEGDVTYVSDNISEYIGIAKVDILGQQIWEYTHQCDHAEIQEALKTNDFTDKTKDKLPPADGLLTDHRDLFIRFKCTLTSRGRSVNIKSASYKVIHLTGHLVVNAKGHRVLIAIGRPIPHPSNIEIPLGSTTFLTKHSLDMKFTYVDDKMLQLLGYEADDLLEKSAYDYQHGGDSDSLIKSFKSALSKGQGETIRYRFLGKYGGYCWIVTQATVVYDKQKPQSIVCVNYVISDLENDDEIYSLAQYEASKERAKEESNNNNKNNNNSCNKNKLEQNIFNVNSEPQKIQENLITSTEIEEITKNYNNDDANDYDDNKEFITIVKEIKSSQSASRPQLLQQISSSPSSVSSSSIEKICIIESSEVKCEKDFFNQFNKTTTNITPIINKNTEKCSTVRGGSGVYRESSLSPLRRKLQSNCSIDKKQSKKNTAPAVNTNVIVVEEKRPKSVTASVFRVADQNLLPPSILAKQQQQQQPLNTNTITTNVNNSTIQLLNQNQLAQLNTTVAPRAQSVTASVFTPKSQLPNLLANRSSHSQQQQQQQQLLFSNQEPVAATTKIPDQSNKQKSINFATSNSQDMNKGYLSFAEDASDLTMLKEEPDELSHLGGPTAVDACLPLFGEMLVGLMSSYGSLLPDDINSLDSTTATIASSTSAAAPITTQSTKKTTTKSSTNTNNNSNRNSNNNTNNINGNNSNKAHIDPFINYREESNDTNCSQHLLSPGGMSKSPEASSLPSLCSPSSLSQDDEFAFMTMNVDDDIDLSMRAPYIPMNEQDDLPLLTDDLMWSAFSEELTIQKDDAMQFDTLKHQMQMQQHQQQQQQQLQLQQQHQSSCSGKTVIDFHQQRDNLSSHSPLPSPQQHQQQQQQYQQHHSPQSNLRNSMCSSPTSSILSMSPSPSNNHQQQNHHHHHTDHHYQNQQQMRHNQNSMTNDFNNSTAVESSLAALLCGNGSAGNGGTISDDNDSGIGSIGNSMSPQQQSHMMSSNFKFHNINQQNHYHHQNNRQMEQQENHQKHPPQPPEKLSQKSERIEDNRCDLIKEKFDNICNSIDDALENVYSKDSPNLDCWNELLEINSSDHLNSPKTSPMRTTMAISTESLNTIDQQQDLSEEHIQQLQQHQSNNVINSSIPLVHVPLIAIQNNKNFNPFSNRPSMDEETSQAPTTMSKDNNHELLDEGGSVNNRKILNTKFLSSSTIDANNTNVNRNGTVTAERVGGTKASLIIHTANLKYQQQQQTHKRHLMTITAMDSKRLKNSSGGSLLSSGIVNGSSSSMDIHNSPQLLQQLMTASSPVGATGGGPDATTILQQRKNAVSAQKWSENNQNIRELNFQKQQQQQQRKHLQQQQQQSSNSVLKNLLISGCDDSKTNTMVTDEEYDLPTTIASLHCDTGMTTTTTTTASEAMRDLRSNPMISGPGAPLPSPILIHDDSNSSYKRSIISIETASAENSEDDDYDNNAEDNDKEKLLSLTMEQEKQQNQCNKNIKIATMLVGMEPPLIISSSNNKAKEKLNELRSPTTLLSHSQSICRTMSISYVDSSNPLMSSEFLMDLCNDDYNMDHESEFLEDNEMESVLNQWTNELA